MILVGFVWEGGQEWRAACLFTCLEVERIDPLFLDV